MIETGLADSVVAPPIAPVDRPIDLGHLARMTLGDRELEREVLRLFERQAEMLLVKMRGASASATAGYAHTRKGSARGIGAGAVAKAALEVETAAQAADPAQLSEALGALVLAVGEARRVIGDLLRAN